jgi:hypothetical protein
MQTTFNLPSAILCLFQFNGILDTIPEVVVGTGGALCLIF